MLKFVHNARRGTNDNQPLSATDTLITSNDLEQAKLIWIKDSQSQLKNDGRFPLWKCQLGLFRHESDVWRCMSNSSLHLAAQTPTLLDKKHCLATLMVMDAYKRVMHDGVQETLTELRSAYWLVRGGSLSVT